MNAAPPFTDFHSHLIPGVDDGAQEPAESAAALERFRADGVTQLVTTPHFLGSLTQDATRLEARLAELDAGWEALRAVVDADAARTGTPMRVERGVEVMLDVPDPDLSDPRLRLAGGSFALVEYGALRLPALNAEFPIAALRQAGWNPVLAHPERYRNLDPSLDTLARLRDMGALMAVNAGSLLGEYGSTAAARARDILGAGFADYVVSDYHARGDPGLTRFALALGEAGCDEQARLLLSTNPTRMLAGELPLPVPPIAATSAPRTVWNRLFGKS